MFAFRCRECGEWHEGSPSFSFDAPAPFYEQSDEIRAKGLLESDLCKYEDADGPHYFVRACLEIPIHGVSEPFLWGVWVSLSKESFDRYLETCEEPEEGISYFG